MAILKHPRAKYPAVAICDVICISDDDSSDDSDEAYEFEDVVVDQTADIGGFSEARFEDIVDETASDDATTLDRLSGETTSHTDVTSSPPPEEGDARAGGDEGIATDREWDLDDESPRTEPADPAREDSHAPGPMDPRHASLGDIFVELAALSGRVAQLEAWKDSHVACQARSLSKKRSRTTSAGPRAKRRKNNTTVNISATRAFVKWDDTSERCLYTWKRGRDGHCWARAAGGEAHEEVDGEYLLCRATTLSVELRANADWLPIEVRYNEDTQVFEGQASVGSQRLEVADSEDDTVLRQSG
ncbi:hypothetical protein QQZ08_010254 [Neonectria magnoliae]|uniref:Uncharacterized protein n=1 Tax=Neonectria magnoliae TaxID=2732573 RepID=A0ABR1HI95_9HYPO